MNKELFLTDTSVRGFIDWLSDVTSKLDVQLDLIRPKFSKTCIGVEDVLRHYQWNGKDWSSTKLQLDEYAKNIRNLISDDGSEADLKDCCLDIVRWGRGNQEKNFNEGAPRDIEELFGQGRLRAYLGEAQNVFSGNSLRDSDLKKVRYVNAMWTKIYALSSINGTPIYDRRGAAAVATLSFLHDQTNQNPLINFPVPTARGTKKAPNRRKQYENGGIIFKFNSLSATDDGDPDWTNATLRLSWIMEVVLERTSLFELEGDLNARKHALEASLFMIGYEPNNILVKNLERN